MRVKSCWNHKNHQVLYYSRVTDLEDVPDGPAHFWRVLHNFVILPHTIFSYAALKNLNIVFLRFLFRLI